MRTGSFVAKPNFSVIQKIEAIRNHDECFIIEKRGPTSFILKPLLHPEFSYQVSIGAKNECSCRSSDICVHILYVLIRYFNIPMTSEILWQKSLTDHEIDTILEGRLARPTAKARQQVYRTKSGKKKVKRLRIAPNDVCPICYDTLDGDVSWCRLGCGGNFHTICVKEWINSRDSRNEPPICPMCRQPLDMSVIDRPQHANKPHPSKCNHSSHQSLPTVASNALRELLNQPSITASQYEQLVQLQSQSVHQSPQRSPPRKVSYSRLRARTRLGSPAHDDDLANPPNRLLQRSRLDSRQQPFHVASRGTMWLENGMDPVIFNRRPAHPPKLQKARSSANPPPMLFLPAYH